MVISSSILLYSSYLLQLLDVGRFSFLKKIYNQRIKFSMQLSINYINKQDFYLYINI